MSPFEVSGLTSVVFWAVAAVAIASAVMVVTVKSVFRAALFLAVSFTAVAFIYFLLSADFIGIVQIVVYVGAVSVLILFAIMLVRNVSEGNKAAGQPVLAALVAALVAGALIYVAFETKWTRAEDMTNPDAIAGMVGRYVELPMDGADVIKESFADASGAKPGVLGDSTGTIGTLLVTDYLLAFEVIGIILTAALIGALAVVRERKPQ